MTREGRLIAELIAQIRQKNLAIFLNIPSVLTLDMTAQDKLNALVHVFEGRYKINDRMVTHKGNAHVFMDPRYILSCLRRKRINPVMSDTKVYPTYTVKGDPIGDTFKKPWYPVGEEAYRAKKENILEKYRHVLKGGAPISTEGGVIRKKASPEVVMALISAGYTIKHVAKELSTSESTVKRIIARFKAKKVQNGS